MPSVSLAPPHSAGSLLRCAAAAALLAACLLPCAFAGGAWGVAGGVILLLALVLIVPRPAAAFGLFLCFLPHLGEPEAQAVLMTVWVPPYLLLAAAWGLAAVTRPGEVRIDAPLLVLYLLLVTTCAWSLRVGLDLFARGEAPAADAARAGARVREALMASSLMVFALSAFRDERGLRRLFQVVMLSGVPYAVTLFFFGPEVELGGHINRYKGFYTSGHAAALHMIVCSVLAVSLLRLERGRRRLVPAACLVLFLATHAATNIRTAQAVMPLLVFCALAMERRARTVALAAVVAAGLLAAAFPFLPRGLQSNVTTIVSAVTGSGGGGIQAYSAGGAKLSTFQLRVEHVRQGLALAASHPGFGVGLGRHGWAVVVSQVSQLHNYYVIVLAETGLAGFLLYASIVAYGLAVGGRLLRLAREAGRRETFLLAQGLLLSLVAVLVMFMTLPGNTVGERYLWPFLGLLVALYHHVRAQAGPGGAVTAHVP